MILIYNQSSEIMSAVSGRSIDLVYAGPPYNIGTRYGANFDLLPLPEYQKLLENVLAECSRVLKDDGVLIVECADTIVSQGVCIQLAGYVQSLCLKLGFMVLARHINFARSKSGIELPEEHWDNEYVTRVNAHSNIHQILVLSKKPGTIFDPNGQITYYDYEPVEGHPCPTPARLCNFVLDTYFTKGMSVLDPFMGSAAIGVEVLKRGGNFTGYERDPSIFRLAQSNLRKGALAYGIYEE